jgi:magnesium-transporting ATPase (P-type)
LLRDNRFSTIVNVAIKGGRVIGINLKKFIYLLGSTNIAEVNIFILCIPLSLPGPATAIMVLYINLITDSIVALALGFEGPEQSVMKEAPADPKAPLIGRAMWIRIGLHTLWSTGMFLGYYITMLQHYTGSWNGNVSVNGIVSDENKNGLWAARASLIILIVTSEMLRGFTAKNFDTNDWRLDNKLLNFSVISGIGLTILITVIPKVNEFFELGSGLGGNMDTIGWVSSLLLSFTVFPVDALLKCFVKRKKAFHKHHIVSASEVPNPERYGLASSPGSLNPCHEKDVYDEDGKVPLNGKNFTSL